MEKINDRIKKIRIENRLTQTEFANSLNLKRGNYAQIEQGNHCPTIKTIQDVVRIYNKNYDWIIDGKKENITNLNGSLDDKRDDDKLHRIAYSREEKKRNVKDSESVINVLQSDLSCKDEIIKGLNSQLQEIRHRLTDKDKQIESLERQIEGLKAGFENQIEDLKNNLGMVIVFKDAMLAMKEEAIKGKEAMLAAKDETIRIQSRHISELESHNEAEDLKKILGSVGKIGEENTTLPNIQPETLSSKAKKGAYQP